jgi:hypothetical protein
MDIRSYFKHTWSKSESLRRKVRNHEDLFDDFGIYLTFSDEDWDNMSMEELKKLWDDWSKADEKYPQLESLVTKFDDFKVNEDTDKADYYKKVGDSKGEAGIPEYREDITMSYWEFERVIYALGGLKSISEIYPDTLPGLKGIIGEVETVVNKYKK